MANPISCRGLHYAATATLLFISFCSLRADVLNWPLNGLELASQAARTIQCVNQLKQIQWAAQVWSNDHAGQPPPSLEALTNELSSPALLFCPANVMAVIPTNWSQVDWSQVDYEWLSLTNWNDPTNIVCTCRIHSNYAQVQGSVLAGDYRPGWPRTVAAPLSADATPGENVRFEVKIDAGAFYPLAYQWRREHLDYETNVVRIINPDDPTGVYWRTNVVAKFTPTALPGETNPVLTLAGVRTNDSDFYSVTASNHMGTAACHPVRLRVDPALAGIGTNELMSAAFCLNNLKMVSLLSRLWEEKHLGQLPLALAAMTNSDGWPLFGWPLALFCRSDTNRTAPPDWSGVNFTNTSYELLLPDPNNPYAALCRCKVHGYYAEVDGDVVRQPWFHGIHWTNGTTVSMNFRVFADKTNLLETSGDLSRWSLLATYAPTNGDFAFSATNTPPRGFYRLRLP